MGEAEDIEWDDGKDQLNRSKHGMPLVLAAFLFDGRPRLDRISRRSPDEEIRFETIAEREGDVLLCVWTWRGRQRRLISLRYANRSERRAYQKAVGGS